METTADNNKNLGTSGQFPKWFIGTNREIALGLFILLSFYVLFNLMDVPKDLLAIAISMGIFGAALYWYSVEKIIPALFKKGKNNIIYYYQRVMLILLVSILPLTGIIYHFAQYTWVIVPVLLFNAGIQLVLIAPVSWIVYLNRNEVRILKTALGRSSANLSILRSQINPHFLFNALNTLYGTALQENAERTGEGIQKLGDMMRFMLQENMQDKISLNREVDYLQNFIDLQKLRTQMSPDIVIQTEITEQLNGLQIAPMLLIPFIENAFKHGISLREPSHIKITLLVTDGVLYFDVYNSTHAQPANDPEKNNNGIGLHNVEQRLQLLYPRKHELTIRETTKEFFVHLTLNLNK